MFELDVEKLKIIAQLMGSIPSDYGRNSITITFYPSFKSGYFNFLFNWKCDNGEISFNNLDEAIKIAERLLERAGGF